MVMSRVDMDVGGDDYDDASKPLGIVSVVPHIICSTHQMASQALKN